MGCLSPSLHLATLCPLVSMIPRELSRPFHQLGSNNLSAPHPLPPPALLLRCRETFCVVRSVRVTKEESYFGTYFGSSHTLQEMEPPHVRSDGLYSKKLARRGRSFLPAKMDPAKPFSVKTRFVNTFGITKDSTVCVCFHADRGQILSCAAS